MRKFLLCAIALVLQLACPVKSQVWNQLSTNTLSDFYSISHVGASHAWFFGDSAIGVNFARGVVLKTTTGGNTWIWQSMSSPHYKVRGSHFFDQNNGIAVGMHNFLEGFTARTSDGGQSWVVDSTTFTEKLHDVHFIDAQTGWICGRNGYVMKTTYGGGSWAAQNTGTAEHLNSIYFASADIGYAVGDAAANETMVRTTDGGTSWTSMSSGVIEDLFTVRFADAAQGWAAGAGGTVLTTADSGATWTAQTSGTGADLFALEFLTASKGWAVGGSGTLLHTADGGTSWSAQTSNTLKDIHAIQLESAAFGWFCGDGGDIFRTGTFTSIAAPAGLFDFELFPNPVRNSSLLWYRSSAEIKSISMISTRGNAIPIDASTAAGTIRLPDALPAGIYFLRFETTAGKSGQQRLVIAN